jgi:hypothetical protein
MISPAHVAFRVVTPSKDAIKVIRVVMDWSAVVASRPTVSAGPWVGSWPVSACNGEAFAELTVLLPPS